MSPKWVIESGYTITRDLPPSVVLWRRFDLYVRNMPFAKALRLMFLYYEVFSKNNFIRIRNVETNETYGGDGHYFPTLISYGPE